MNEIKIELNFNYLKEECKTIGDLREMEIKVRKLNELKGRRNK